MNEFVVGVDGSDHSRLALRWSMRLGSTANHLVRHSSTNVAVVPGPAV
jgi:nucleotide-binding universal stress UspA family protein